MAGAEGSGYFKPSPKLFSVSWKCPTLPAMSNFLPACWQGLGGEQREKERREEGLPAWRPLSHSGCNSCRVWGRSALLRDFKVELGLQEDFGIRAKETQLLTEKRCVVGLGRPLAAFAIPEIAT